MNPYQPPAAALVDRPAGAVEPFTSVLGLLGRASSVYSSNLGIIAAVTLVVFVPVELAKNWIIVGAHLQERYADILRLEMVVESVFGSLVTAALLYALVEKMERGRTVGVKEALSAGAKRWGAVFGARFRAGLYILVGLLLLVVPGVMFMVRYALTDEVATLEVDRSGPRVLERSKELAQGKGGMILGVGVLSFLLVSVPQFMGGFLSGLVDWWVVTALIDAGVDVLYRFFVVVTLLMYLGLAGREGRGAPPAG